MKQRIASIPILVALALQLSGCASYQLQEVASTQPVTLDMRFDAMQKDLNTARAIGVLFAAITLDPYRVVLVRNRFNQAQAVLDKSRKYAADLDIKGELDQEKITAILEDVAEAIGNAKA